MTSASWRPCARPALGSRSKRLRRRVDAPRYGVLVLLEAGLAAGVVRSDGDRFVLTKTGACVLLDELTRINMDFVHHDCFQALYYLEESIREGKPAGLQHVFGDWDTVYRALSALPEAARTSWFKMEPVLLGRSLSSGPAHRLRKTASNTAGCGRQHGKVGHPVRAALPRGCGHDPRPAWPGGCRQSERPALGLQARIAIQPCDLLDHSQAFPAGFDAIWMSQFLVCFAESDVRQLLERAAAAMAPDSRLYILDTFWDRQDHEISAYCLQASSLYFTCLANGCSRMYKADDVAAMVEAAGMAIERVTGTLGICSSLMICRRR